MLHAVLQYLTSFRARQGGVGTIDWIVVSAAVVGLSFAIIASIAAADGDASPSDAQQLFAPDHATVS